MTSPADLSPTPFKISVVDPSKSVVLGLDSVLGYSRDCNGSPLLCVALLFSILDVTLLMNPETIHGPRVETLAAIQDTRPIEKIAVMD
jgi:hypothetical protein